ARLFAKRSIHFGMDPVTNSLLGNSLLYICVNSCISPERGSAAGCHALCHAFRGRFVSVCLRRVRVYSKMSSNALNCFKFSQMSCAFALTLFGDNAPRAARSAYFW